MCRHKRLFLLQGSRKEDSGAPDRQPGSTGLHAGHSAPAVGSKPRGLPGVEELGGGKPCKRAPVGRFAAGVGGLCPRNVEASSAVGGKRKEDTEEVERKMASCLIRANQEERKTTPILAVSWSAVEKP